MANPPLFATPSSLAGQTVAAALRQFMAPLSWSEARQLVAGRRVRVNGTVCLDDARRLRLGDQLQVLGTSTAHAAPRPEQLVRIVFSDADVVVVEKPADLQTVRRNEERDWSVERKSRQPVLQEVIQRMLAPPRRDRNAGRKPAEQSAPRVRAVHRLDRDTSGLMLFALSPGAEQELIRLFSRHAIDRVYRAVVHGNVSAPRTIESFIARDRGDGVRGSVADPTGVPGAQHAITHVRPIESIGREYSLVECRLQTGRTHQIRIHLAEAGHMLCGEKVYVQPRPGAPIVQDVSGAPRQALHSAELRFVHPITGKPMRFESPWPADLQRWIQAK